MTDVLYVILQQIKFTPYLHQSVSAGTHECVHHTIKGVVMRISSHMTHSFTWGRKGGSIKQKNTADKLCYSYYMIVITYNKSYKLYFISC